MCPCALSGLLSETVAGIPLTTAPAAAAAAAAAAAERVACLAEMAEGARRRLVIGGDSRVSRTLDTAAPGEAAICP